MRTVALLALFGAILSSSGTKGNLASVVDFRAYGGTRNGPNSALKPFQQKNTEYTFIYSAQIASGLQTAAETENTQQRAVTRIECVANIQFASERHGQLQLDACRAGQRNEQMPSAEAAQPFDLLEQKQIPSQTIQQLQKPCQFICTDGLIERVQCPEDDNEWTKNFKKSVLSIIQLNLKRINAEDGQQEEAAQMKRGKSFTVQEITLEGACQTTYTVNRAASAGMGQKMQQQQQQQYNITKAINFNKCQQIADVANGFQTDPPQAQCAQCQSFWAQQQNGDSEWDSSQNGDQQKQQQQNPCAKCDPKEVKEHELDRSTVIRCQIQGEPSEQYTLHGCEMRSQYLYRNSKSAVGENGAAMQTTVLATLKATDARLMEQQQIPAMSANAEETLLYSNSKEVDEKRFYRNGDDDFGVDGKGSPFAQVPKVQQAEQALLKLVQNLQDQPKSIDQQAPVQQQRLVEMLRMCTQQELNRVEQNCPGTTAAQQDQCKQIFVNGLAECGTKNCVAELAKRIKNKQISQANAAKALLALAQLPAPSDSIVEEMEQLCSFETVDSQPTLKQSCWLSFGAMVNELCQHTTANNAQQCAGEAAQCVQSGIFEKDQCPTDKKQKYKEAMLNVFQNSQCIFDKVVALSALGNAGLENSMNELEQIITNLREPRVVRVMAIHATRRLPLNAPCAVQSVLLPVFMNTREHPHVRIAAFANLMEESARPQPQVVDQLMYAISNEPNKEVQAYAYRTMKAVAKSQKPIDKAIAKHIRSALKMANVDEQQLDGSSGKWQFGLFNAQAGEGMFVSLAQATAVRSALPAYAHVQLDSLFNDQHQLGNLKLFMLQQEVEQWYGNIANRWAVKSKQQPTRGQRQNDHSQQNSEKLSAIRKALDIKERRSFFGTIGQVEDNSSGNSDNDGEIDTYQQQKTEPFATLMLRSNNVDKAFIALDEHLMSEQTRRILSGQQNKHGEQEEEEEQKAGNWASLLFGQGKQQLAMSMPIVQNLHEKQAKIPTSVGVPLRILNTMPVLANFEGQMGIIKAEPSASSFSGIQLGVNAKAAARISQIQKMEIWTPFVASGVESVRSAQFNVPLQGELNANPGQGIISLKVKLPKQKTQLASAHSLPFTFIAKVDQQSKLVREPRHIATIHDPKLERQQHELNAVQGQKNLAMPLHFRGHYHWPAEPTSYQQFAQLLLATENAVSIYYQPNEDSPRDAIFRISGEHFQKLAQKEQPGAQLRSFFAEPFTSSCSSDNDDEQCEQFVQQQQQREDAQEAEDEQSKGEQSLHSVINAYKPRQQYKHSLKLIAQTEGGAKDAKAECDVQAMCDEESTYCKMLVSVVRPPIGNEGQQWALNAQADVLMPQIVASVEQLQAKPKPPLQQQFIALASAQWGQQREQQQQLNIRVHGTQAQTQQIRAMLEGMQQQSEQQGNQLISSPVLRKIQRRSAFLNKFQVAANYSLNAYSQNAINRALELLKSAYFWNTKSQLLESGQSAQKNGKIAATILIDPITVKHANITIRTPAQQLRMEQIEMPYKLRPFALVRQRSAEEEQRTHSVAQLFHQFSAKFRAQCTADGRKVNTFDEFAYTAPLSSNCYSVLAKDCASEEPKFAVLMKKVPQKQQHNKSAQNAAKVLKVITPEQQIECRPRAGANGRTIAGKMICTVNGVQQQHQFSTSGVQQCQDDGGAFPCVQFNRPDEVTVRTEAVTVRFNGRKALLKLAQAYKHKQCGLCGHYDDNGADPAEELRMANGESASGLAEFHRSYALEDAEQCSEQTLNNFYSDQKQNNDQQQQEEEEEEEDTYHKQYNNEQQQQFDSEEVEEDESEQKLDEWDPELQQFNGQFDWSEQSDDQPFDDDNDDIAQWKAVRPILTTKILEQNHAVCFSTRPVKQCPRGALAHIPLISNEQQQQAADEKAQQHEQKPKTTKVSFVCLERSESETRRLLRSLRRGAQRVAEVNARGPSFTQFVREPQQCWARRGRN